jgi:hypothetical protein
MRALPASACAADRQERFPSKSSCCLGFSALEFRSNRRRQTPRERVDVVAVGIASEGVLEQRRHRGLLESHREHLDLLLVDARGRASASSFRHHSELTESGETTAIRKSPSLISSRSDRSRRRLSRGRPRRSGRRGPAPADARQARGRTPVFVGVANEGRSHAGSLRGHRRSCSHLLKKRGPGGEPDARALVAPPGLFFEPMTNRS